MMVLVRRTGRPPVRIKDENWPIIAAAEWRGGMVAPPHVPMSHRRAWVRVRRHSDGRHLIYGYAAGVQSSGYLLHAMEWPASVIQAAIIQAAQVVAGEIGHDELWREVIADLPPEEI